MDYTYSPHREAGGTLHLPSPTHVRSHSPHVDALSASFGIPRSVSRSPSKPSFGAICVAQTPQQSPAGQGPNTQTFTPQVTPPLFGTPSNVFAISSSNFSTPDLTIVTPAKKKFHVRRLASKSAKSVGRSPMRRALSDAANQSNITPTSSQQNSGEENRSDSSSSPELRSVDAKPVFKFDMSDRPARFEFQRPRPDVVRSAMRHDDRARSSPLKRSDGREPGQLDFGTPVKRRSMHGGNLAVESDIFNQASSPLHLPAPQHAESKPLPQVPRFSDIDVPHTSFSSPALKRASSVRKLSHRPTPAARPRTVDHSNEPMIQSSPLFTARYRHSLDVSSLLSTSRAAQASFAGRPQISVTTQPAFAHPAPRPTHQPHPLSKALIPSSSGSNLTEEEHIPEIRRLGPHLRKPEAHAFAKSLPIGAIRPHLNSQGSSDSFATPTSFKSNKSQAGGFLSTGLISKRNRNPDFHPYNDTERYTMPDTPSKRASFPPVTATPFPKDHRTPFGEPETPIIFHPRPSADLFGRGSGLFTAAAPIRRSSFVSDDGEEQSPTPNDSQSSADELPPTPTKINGSGRVKSNSLRSSLFGRRTSLGPETFAAPTQAETNLPRLTRKGKRNSLSTDFATGEETKKDILVCSSPAGAPSSPIKQPASPVKYIDSVLASLSRLSPSHASARSRERSSSSCKPSSKLRFATKYSLSTYANKSSPSVPETKRTTRLVTPVNDNGGRTSPHTPSSSFHGGASTGQADQNALNLSVFKASTTVIPPVTPTAQRDQPFNFSVAATMFDFDTSITSRFSSVSTLAQGEFSIVYKVERPIQLGFLRGLEPPSPGKAWVVKKTKKPYVGMRDRQNKLREVDTLKELRGSDHVLEYLDSWEANNHLFIQTEYCENGSLAEFLKTVGFKARVDDFRIWKILLELSLGVQSIHDANFMHLDLKPANIFITFEGVLKIGDFGLATHWPASADVDGEGDREYISPEILSQGRVDKPADVFALGLMALEIAGNFFLPDNGDQWQRLRSGNLSDIPSLTWSMDSRLSRDENGDPVGVGWEDDEDDAENVERSIRHQHAGHWHAPPPSQRYSGLFGSSPSPRGNGSSGKNATSPSPTIRTTPTVRNELPDPPQFMRDPQNPHSLDHLVEWMLSPDPDVRPTIGQVLATHGLNWVAGRRRAGATIYEGNWGPKLEGDMLERHNLLIVNEKEDVEMEDV